METTVGFTGDIAYSGYFKRSTYPDVVSDDIQSFLKNCDYVVADIECPITDVTISADKPLNHVSSPECIKSLRDLNINVLCIGNNHIMDCGEAGLNDTICNGKNNECIVFGAGENIHEAARPTVLGDDVKIGIISVTNPWDYCVANTNTPGTLSWNEKELIQKQINELRNKVNWIVIIAHGGDEFTSIPLPSIRRKYRSFLKMGADIVVGHHPHVVQNYEKIGNKIIFYSIGNFIFDTDFQRIQAHTENGIILRITFGEKRYDWDFCPILIERENNIVVRGETPEIFCEFDRKKYNALWPLAAKYFYMNDRIALIYKKKELKNRTKLKWLWVEIKGLRHRKNREVMIGRVSCLFGEWKKTKWTKLADYIMAGIHNVNQTQNHIYK